MSRVRNLYVYGICAISLLFLATGVENLIRLLVQTASGSESTGWLWLNRGDLRQQISFFAALALIGGPVWLGHWVLASRGLSAAERGSGVRRFYLYLMLAGALIFFLPGAINLLRLPVWALLGAQIGQPYLSALGAPLGLLVVTVPIWLYHRRLALAEAASAGDDGSLGTVRRLYFYAAGFGLASFLLINESRLGTSVWEGLIRPAGTPVVEVGDWVRLALPAYAIAALVFLATWWWHWSQTERIAAEANPRGRAELASVLRRVYVYGLILIGLIVVLVNATTLLNDLFRAVLGSPNPTGTGRPLAIAVGQPLVWGLVYGAFWLNLRGWLQRDASRAPEASEQAALRRLYAYLVAAVGLVVLAIGLILLLSTVLSLPTLTPEQQPAEWLRGRISSALTLVVVGAPVWLISWQGQQRRLLDPTLAPAERASLWRRIYLYLALFVGVVAALVDAASVLYQLLLAAVGDHSTPSLLGAIATPLSVIVVASTFLVYHWRALRSDSSAAASTRAATGGNAAVTVVILRGQAEEVERAVGRLTAQANGQLKLEVLRGADVPDSLR